MTAAEYRAAIERLGLSQAAAARRLGISDRQSHRYATGATAVPERVVLHLRALEPVDEQRVREAP